MGTYGTCTSVDCVAMFVNELEHGHASVVPMTDGVTILVGRLGKINPSALLKYLRLSDFAGHSVRDTLLPLTWIFIP